MIISGIYQIKNKVNGKVYIGSSNNIENRWAHHRYRLRNNIHHSFHLQQSWNKYGSSSFEFSILEATDNSSLIEREQFWIDKNKAADYRYGYNACPNAGSSRDYSKAEREYSKWWTERRNNRFSIEDLPWFDSMLEDSYYDEPCKSRYITKIIV